MMMNQQQFGGAPQGGPPGGNFSVYGHHDAFAGFGFVEFADQQSAQNAINLSGQDFRGRVLRCNWANKYTSPGGGQ